MEKRKQGPRRGGARGVSGGRSRATQLGVTPVCSPAVERVLMTDLRGRFDIITWKKKVFECLLKFDFGFFLIIRARFHDFSRE